MKKLILHTPYSILQYLCFIAIVTTYIAMVFLFPSSAEALGLKITPLKYEEQIELGSSMTGFVDVANPNDASIVVSTGVKGFEQVDTDGNLGFYDDEQLSQGITFDVSQFELGPREAARVQFHIDSNQLPEGGIYAVLFFETLAQRASPKASSIETTSRVGTLLILENGSGGVKEGSISSVDIDFWQFGDGVKGSLAYRNPESELAIGFTPQLSGRLLWGEDKDIEAGLVLPGVTREFPLELKGDYFGLVPVTITDAVTGAEATRWVLAVTGVWRLIAPSLILALVASYGLYRRYSRRRR